MSIAAVDTGGTFTDVVTWDGTQLRVHKLPSTPRDPAAAVIAGVRAGGALALLIHGSTVATNALLERKGARVALITNEGFEDVLELGRQTRPQLYALVGTRPPPLIPRERRVGVRGRLDHLGRELVPLDGEELAGLLDALRTAESIAVCLLHSYANDAHERAVCAALAPLGVPLSRSSELLPEFREYERTATTAVNAYVSPLMDRYLARVEAETGAARVRIMGSGGGALPVARARREAVHTVLSGPAGGVAGARAVAARHGIDHIMTFDMGGTSTDVALCPGRALHTREFRIADLPVAVPVLDIHTVGAGGGSLAWVDAAGALRVGPESAGADPGPICYGRGGTRVTVTDAHVWLGRIPSAEGTALERLDRAAIEPPLQALAAALGMDTPAAAAAIIAVADAAMEGALRVISVERGYDPAGFTLVPFGGAAGLHAVELAARLGIPRLLLPPDPGLLSAFGMLVAPVRKESARTVLQSGRSEADFALEPVFAALEADSRAAMAEEGIWDPSLERRVAARYAGQSYELDVPAEGWIEAFHEAHLRRYGHGNPGAAVEAVTLRVEALAPGAQVPAPVLPEATSSPVPSTAAPLLPGAPPARVIDRVDLRAGHEFTGPVIVREYSATTWIPSGWRGITLGDGSVALERA